MSLFIFGQLFCFFLHNWLGLGPFLRCVHNFSKVDPTAVMCMDGHTYYGVGPISFLTPRRLPVHVQTGKSSLTSGVGTLSLYFNKAQLLPLALPLGCLDDNKAWISLHLTNSSCPAQGSIYLLPQEHYSWVWSLWFKLVPFHKSFWVFISL